LTNIIFFFLFSFFLLFYFSCISDDPHGTVVMCLHKIQFDALIKDDVSVRDVLQRNSEIAAMGMLLSDANNEDMVVSRRAASHATTTSSAAIADKAVNAMHDDVVVIVNKRHNSPGGVDDFVFLPDAALRLRMATTTRRIPDIIRTINFDDPKKSTKLSLARVIRQVLQVQKGKRNSQQICFLMCVFRETTFFQRYCSRFAPHQLAELCSSLTYKCYRKNATLFNLGTPGKTVFVVLSGLLESRSRLSMRAGTNEMQEAAVKKTPIGSGNAAGVVALQNVGVRINTVVSKLDTELMCIESEDWFAARNVGKGSTLIDRLNVLGSCSLFEHWSHDCLVQLNFVCEEQIYSKGSVFAKKGTRLRGLYIVLSGEVAVSFNYKVEAVNRNKKSKKSEKEKGVAAKINKQLCNSFSIMAGAVFPLMSLLSYSHNLEEVPLSNCTATASSKCNVLFLPMEEFQYIINDKRFDTMKKVVDLQRQRQRQCTMLDENTKTHAGIHFVPPLDTKWLEMARSRRVVVHPPPIVDCTLQKASESVVADVLLSAQREEKKRIGSTGELLQLSAATAIHHSRAKRTTFDNKQAKEKEKLENVFDSHTKIFDRSNLWNVRSNDIYLAKRAKRYNLERDARWLATGTSAIDATCAQDPLLPFVASSAKWLQSPGKAVATAAKAAMDSDMGSKKKPQVMLTSSSRCSTSFLQSSQPVSPPVDSNGKEDEEDTLVRSKKKKMEREKYKKMMKSMMFKLNSSGAARPSENQALALPPAAIKFEVKVRVREEKKGNKMKVLSPEPETIREGEEERSIGNVARNRKQEEESWKWMDKVQQPMVDMLSSDVVESPKLDLSSTCTDVSTGSMFAAAAAEEAAEASTSEAVDTDRKVRKKKKIRRKKKSNGNKKTAMITNALTGLEDPFRSPPTGVFFPRPKNGGASKRVKKLEQLKMQQRNRSGYM